MESSLSAPHRPAVNRLPCVFALPLAKGQAVCECARRSAAPARSLCADPLARAACAEFDGLLREKSVFALRRLPASADAGRGKATVSLHAAGLHALQAVLDPEAPAPNVHALLRVGQRRFGSCALFPWDDLIRAIAAWRPGRRVSQGIIGR